MTSSGPLRTSSYSALERISLLILLIVGVGARLHSIGGSFDGDEIFSVTLASKPLGATIAGAVRDTSHPPLHYLLLHLWIAAFGSSEAAIRASNVVLSAGFLVAAYALYRRLVAPRIAVALLAILALSPLFVYYGQWARPYALIALASTLNLIAYLKLLETRGSNRRRVLWTLSCVLLVYCQYLGILLVALETCLAIYHSRTDRWKILAGGATAVAAIVPWFLASVGPLVARGADPLPYISWMVHPTLKNLLGFYVSILGDAPGLRARWPLMCLALLAAAYLRRLIVSRTMRIDHVFVLLVSIGLPVLVWAISVLGPKPAFEARQLMPAAIAFVALLGLCASTFPEDWEAAFTVALVAWTITAYTLNFTHQLRPPWRDIARRIDAQYAGAVVVADELWVRDPLVFYRRTGPTRLWSETPVRERNGTFLFVCRPRRSPELEGPLKFRSRLVAAWEWGTSSEGDSGDEVRLYAIGGAP